MKIPFNPTHAPFVENRNFGNAFSYISSMKTTHLTLTALVCIATAAACTSPEKQPEKVVLQPPPTITVKDFFKNPEKASFRISPDGELHQLSRALEEAHEHFRAEVGEEMPCK
jgi:hypothetical protein